MYKNSIILLFGLVAIFFAGCKKENNNGLNIEGKWRKISGGSPRLKYMVVNSDKTIQVLSSDTGFHNNWVNAASYTRDNDLILAAIGTSDFEHYRLRMNGDTLYLLQNESLLTSGANLVFLKDASAPAYSEWVTNLSFTRIMNALANSEIAYDGTFLIARYGASGLAKVNLATKMIESVVTPAFSSDALESNSSTYIGSDYNKLKTISPNDGSETGSTTAAPISGSIQAIAFSGTKLYCIGYSSEYQLFYFDMVSGNFSAPVTIGTDVNDLAFKGGKLYATSYKYIYRIDPSTFKVDKTYAIPDYSFSGIAIDATDNDFFVSIYNNSESIYAKVSLN